MRYLAPPHFSLRGLNRRGSTHSIQFLSSRIVSTTEAFFLPGYTFPLHDAVTQLPTVFERWALDRRVTMSFSITGTGHLQRCRRVFCLQAELSRTTELRSLQFNRLSVRGRLHEVIGVWPSFFPLDSWVLFPEWRALAPYSKGKKRPWRPIVEVRVEFYQTYAQ